MSNGKNNPRKIISKVCVLLIVLFLLMPLLMPLLMHCYNELTTVYIETKTLSVLNNCKIEVLDSNRYHGKLSGNGNGMDYCCVFLIKGNPEETMSLLEEKNIKYGLWYKKDSHDGVFDSDPLEHRIVKFDNEEFRNNPDNFFALFVYYDPKNDLLTSIDWCAH